MIKKILLGFFACCLLMQAQAHSPVWLIDLPAALNTADSQHKLVLADFTGSDWCIWCKRLDTNILSTKIFAKYADKNLVLLRLDYPRKKPQSAELKAANKALAKKYKLEGFPTLIAFRPDGSIAWQNVGYMDGGPQVLIDALNKAKQK